MPDVVTDTHGLIWYLEDSPRLGPAARKAFDACDRGEIVVYIPTFAWWRSSTYRRKGAFRLI